MSSALHLPNQQKIVFQRILFAFLSALVVKTRHLMKRAVHWSRGLGRSPSVLCFRSQQPCPGCSGKLPPLQCSSSFTPGLIFRFLTSLLHHLLQMHTCTSHWQRLNRMIWWGSILKCVLVFCSPASLLHFCLCQQPCTSCRNHGIQFLPLLFVLISGCLLGVEITVALSAQSPSPWAAVSVFHRTAMTCCCVIAVGVIRLGQWLSSSWLEMWCLVPDQILCQHLFI